MISPPFDAVTRERLARPTSRKWSLYPETIGAWVAEMDFGTAPQVTDALLEGVRSDVFGYLTPALARELSEATADWYGDEFGWRPEPRFIHLVTDVLATLEITVTYFSRPGSAVIVPTPAYMPFLSLPQFFGRDLIQVPGSIGAGRWELDFDAIDAAFAAGGGTLILCNPHNPTGRVFDRTELERVAEIVARYDGRVFADEIHAALRYPGASHIPYASISQETARHTITGTSASKAWNIPGLKAAQLILSNPADAETYRLGRFGRGHGPATLGVIASIAAYRDGGAWLDEVIEYLDRNRRLLDEQLPKLLPGVGYVSPESTYMAWLDCRDLEVDGTPESFFRTRAGVTLTDGALCGTGFDQYLRLVFATPRPILEEALQAMAGALS